VPFRSRRFFVFSSDNLSGHSQARSRATAQCGRAHAYCSKKHPLPHRARRGVVEREPGIVRLERTPSLKEIENRAGFFRPSVLGGFFIPHPAPAIGKIFGQELRFAPVRCRAGVLLEGRAMPNCAPRQTDIVAIARHLHLVKYKDGMGAHSR